MKVSARSGNRNVEATIEREDGHYVVEVDGRRRVVDAQKLEGDFYSFLTEGRSYEVSVEARRDQYLVRHGAAEKLVSLSDPGRRAREGFDAAAEVSQIVAQMPGKVVRLLVVAGDAVEAGQGIVVIEAMKMENEIGTPREGRVQSIEVQPGQTVDAGALLVVLE